MQLRKLTDEDYDSDMPLPFLDDPEPPVVKEILTTEQQEETLFKQAIADPDSPEGRRVLELTNEIENEYVKVIVSTGAKYAEIQNILSNPRNGSFTAYLEWKGLAKSNVYRLINSYNFIVSNGHNKELIESLPIRVLAAAGSPSADPELKEKVAAGEVTTIKELEAWKEEKKKLEAKLLEVIDNSVKIEQELKAVKGADAHLRYQLDKMAKEQQQAVEKEVNARLKEELKKQQEALQEALRKQEAMVARLEDELTILRPLKRREEEIQQKLKELDEAREEVHRAKARNVLFDAVTKARKSFNDAIYPVVTVAMTPEIYGDTLKKELMDLVEMTENFTYALKQKFNL